MEALGFVPFWGFSPPVNFFKGTSFDVRDTANQSALSTITEVNVLISECTDLRHLLKTIAETVSAENF